MPRRVLSNAERVSRRGTEMETAGRRQIRRSIEPRWSNTEEGRTSNEALDHGRGGNGRPRSPPPPYSEYDYRLEGGQAPPYSVRSYRLEERQTSPYSRYNLYPTRDGRPDYVLHSSGRRDRYVLNENSERVLWPFMDHECSSDEGEGGPDWVYMESGRIIPRSEHEADNDWEPSSDDGYSSGGTDGETSQAQRRPVPEARDATPFHWSSEAGPFNSETPRVRSGHSAGFRHSRRQNVGRYGGQSSHGSRDLDARDRRRSGR